MPSSSPLMLNQYVGLLPAVFWPRAKDPYIYGVDFLAGDVEHDDDRAVADQLRRGLRVLLPDGDVLRGGQHHRARGAGVHAANRGRGLRAVLEQPGDPRAHTGSGRGSLPYLFIKPKLVGGGSTLTFAITNLSGTSYNVRIALHGLKLYPFPETGYYSPLPMVNS